MAKKNENAIAKLNFIDHKPINCTIEYAYKVTEPDYDEFDSYTTEIINTFGDDKDIFDKLKNKYEGKTSYYFLQTNEKLTNDCIDIICGLCLIDKDTCIVCKYNFTLDRDLSGKISKTCLSGSSEETQQTDSDISKEETDIIKKETDLSKEETDLKKEETDLNKEETDLKKEETNLKKEETDLKKEDTDLKKVETDLNKENEISNKVKISNEKEIYKEEISDKEVSKKENDSTKIEEKKAKSTEQIINADKTNEKEKEVEKDKDKEIEKTEKITEKPNTKKTCNNSEILNNTCHDGTMTNEQFNELSKEIEEKYINGENTIILTGNVIFQISKSDDQKINIYNNISSIDLGECESKIKEQYSIDEDDSLIIYKQDKRTDNIAITYVQYKVI